MKYSFEDFWNAVVTRNPTADTDFLYGVRTTGIYCRPSCPSRLPKRENIQFFADQFDAEQRGYRACRKCRPQVTEASAVPESVVRTCRVLDLSERPISLAVLARAVKLSPAHLHRQFRKYIGVTPRAYRSARRAQRLRAELLQEQSVTSAMHRAGYSTSARDYRKVGDLLGMTPTALRGGGDGELIDYSIARSSMGWLLVAATRRGICAIEMGGNRTALFEQLKSRFPNATLCQDAPRLQPWIFELQQFLDSPGEILQLPLDIRGTAFQCKVWEVLRSIPLGTTTTYTRVAAQIGQPRAVRAVANACAANSLAIAVPCHRVIRSDGDLANYRWGKDRKQVLLDREAKATERKPDRQRRTR